MYRDKPLKTLGPQAARLIAELHERGKNLFSHADVEEITSLPAKSARNFVALPKRLLSRRVFRSPLVFIRDQPGSGVHLMGADLSHQ